jgi:DNA modification methylase
MGWHYRRNYEFMLVGEKPGAACHWFGGDSEANVIRLGKIIPQADDHPTPKPVALMAKFMRLHSVPGDLVVDPFMGGGPTAIAARLLGRRFIGCEVSEEWCEMTARRLDQAVLPLDPAPFPSQLALDGAS